MIQEQDMETGDPSKNDESEEKLAAALASVRVMECEAGAETADAAWQKFRTKLEASDAEPQDLSEARLRPAEKTQSRTSVWRRIRAPRTSLGWLATAQTAALAAMAFVLVPQSQGEPTQPDEYRTLSADGPAVPAAPAGNAVLLFDGAVSSAQINETLNQAGARIVDGPMANGGYVIEVDEGLLESTVENLRTQDGVVLVELLKAEEQP